MKKISDILFIVLLIIVIGGLVYYSYNLNLKLDKALEENNKEQKNNEVLQKLTPLYEDYENRIIYEKLNYKWYTDVEEVYYPSITMKYNWFPVININTEDVKRLNNTLRNDEKKLEEKVFAHTNTNDGCLTIEKSGEKINIKDKMDYYYEVSVSNDFISIVRTYSFGDTCTSGYQYTDNVYIISTNTGKLISNDELIKFFGINNFEKSLKENSTEDHSFDAKNLGTYGTNENVGYAVYLTVTEQGYLRFIVEEAMSIHVDLIYKNGVWE